MVSTVSAVKEDVYSKECLISANTVWRAMSVIDELRAVLQQAEFLPTSRMPESAEVVKHSPLEDTVYNYLAWTRGVSVIKEPSR
ncbi:hypothetical protein P879_09887 [Paragonimus westermani]|uniref:Uncharacterized protein n=1 Tax=Paragonimus westermani TaxID=34504 RepID=A0A8T0DAY4_9TREM|nr:hypothetical protein P879_09887 [Paragonimus westermani]